MEAQGVIFLRSLLEILALPTYFHFQRWVALRGMPLLKVTIALHSCHDSILLDGKEDDTVLAQKHHN